MSTRNEGETSHARAREAATEESRAEYAALVSEISRRMARQQWDRGVDGPLLAAERGIPEWKMDRAASEASRRVLALSDPQEVRAIASYYLAKSAEAIDDLDSSMDAGLTVKKAEAMAKVMTPWARIAGVPSIVATGPALPLPEQIQEAQHLAETGDARGLATVRAYAELEVQTVDAAARERARRLREDWALLSDEARADVFKMLEGLR
jgi:hypothetical protein